MEDLNKLQEEKKSLEIRISKIQKEKDNKENRKKAIYAIKEILGKENISKIFYIDDKFEDNEIKNSFIAKAKEVKNGDFKNKQSLEGFEDIEWDTPPDIFKNKISELWKQGNHKELYHNICNIIGDDDSSNVIPILEIQEDFNEIVKVFSPCEWQEKESEIIENLNAEAKGLFLFDYEFRNSWRGRDGEKNGIDLAKKIIEGEKSEYVYCGIFSHIFSIEDEDEYRIKFSSEKDIDKNSFYTISKKRYAYDPKLSAFAEGVKNIISLRYIEDLKSISKTILEQSIKDSFKEFDKMSPKTFNQVIQQSAKKEGSLEIKELFRIFNLILNNNNYKSISDKDKRKEFNEATLKVRDIDIDTGYIYDDKDIEAVKLRERELYIDGDILNKLNIPISNGDIFKVGNKEFILLVQPCNVSLRVNGRRSYNYNKVHLVPILELKKTLNNLTQQVLLTSNTDYYVDFSNFKIISLNILDLTVFHREGNCVIDMNKSEIDNDLIQAHWRKRYKKLFKIFQKHENAILAFDEINTGTTKNTLNPYVKKPYCIQEFKIGDNAVYNRKNKVFDFKIKRVRHYKTPYSSDLLQNFMSYLSRNAFEHDFTN